ncbi:MAG: NAD(P)/FAD-dependent oxidoreductase [Clostridia bacterium]|nr:NAD(P)/FAD-dependent oxidoreductase [Clostridia bacterium]
MKEFDLVVIGGGIVGCNTFSEAVLNGINTCLLESSNDVSAYATKANSGIVHSGYDPIPGSLMAKYNVLGNKMYKSMCERLGVEYLECGTLTVSKADGKEALMELKKRGEENGVLGLRIIEEAELKQMEPNLSDDIKFALFAPTGGVVSPYSVCIALAEEGIINGGEIQTKFEVKQITKDETGYILSDGIKSVHAKYVINCAGPNANEINKLLNTKTYPMRFVKGEYILLDKSTKGYINHPIFPLPTKVGKGILANITVHGNIMFGPTAVDCQKDDRSVDLNGVEKIKEQILQTVKEPNFKKTIKLFAGIRVKTGSDFVVERDETNKNYYYAVGICSPGLTAAPAIAKDFLEMLKKDGIKTKPINYKKRKPYIDTQNMSSDELDNLIKQNPLYGKIVCRCEHISEAEIIDALNSPLHPVSIDALKRRVRPTMGRCQGSFCIPKLIRIMANERRLKKEQIALNEKGSELIVGDIKNGGK